MLENFKSGIMGQLRSWLRIYPSQPHKFAIYELLDFDSNVQVNRIWYRGESYELRQLYEQIQDDKFSFWGAKQTAGMQIRKIHTGLPKIIVDQLAGLTMADMEDVSFTSAADETTWAAIEKENDFENMVTGAVVKCLAYGDGAFKISLQPGVSKYPIIEFFEADRIRVMRNCGRINEIVFKTAYTGKNSEQFVLEEHYGFGYVTYELKNNAGKVVPLDTLLETAGLVAVAFDPSFMMAEYMSFYNSSKWAGRGQSIFDSKRDNFDALDEAWSQWMDALRAGRSKTYIPDTLIPRNANGQLLQPNAFDNRFIKVGSDQSENGKNQISTVQAAIPHDSYLATYITALDLCLQGIVSPSTLGIDVKKLDNAEAQREKEKATLYTRQVIVGALQSVLPKVIQDVFNVLNTTQGAALETVGATVQFGEYANPSFESQVETVGKAKASGVMSIYAAVEELYGDTQTDEWKAEEVKRIMNEQGIMEVREPAVNMDIEGSGDIAQN